MSDSFILIIDDNLETSFELSLFTDINLLLFGNLYSGASI